MKDATEPFHYPELVGELLRMKLYFSSPLVNVTKFILLGEGMSPDAVDKFGIVVKNL